MIPTSRQQFKEKCLRNLGWPVLPIELDDDQIEDKIDSALQFYQDYHYDATERLLYKHQITQTDLDNRYISIPENIIGVSSILSFGSGLVSNPPFGAKYQVMLNDFFNMTSSNLVPYNNTMTYLNMINEFFSLQPGIRYNRHGNKLYIDLDWKNDLKVDMWLVINAIGVLDPNVYSDIWSDRWLLKYATQLMRQQIGVHLGKFNITLPGGVTYNGDQIYQEASRILEEMEAEMIEKYSSVPPIYIG